MKLSELISDYADKQDWSDSPAACCSLTHWGSACQVCKITLRAYGPSWLNFSRWRYLGCSANSRTAGREAGSSHNRHSSARLRARLCGQEHYDNVGQKERTVTPMNQLWEPIQGFSQNPQHGSKTSGKCYTEWQWIYIKFPMSLKCSLSK